MSVKPHQETELAKYVAKRVLALKPRKSQIEIAAAAGFVHPNMVSMIKSGASKLPQRLRELVLRLERRLQHAQYEAGDAAAGLRATVVGGGPVEDLFLRFEQGWVPRAAAVQDAGKHSSSGSGLMLMIDVSRAAVSNELRRSCSAIGTCSRTGAERCGQRAAS